MVMAPAPPPPGERRPPPLPGTAARRLYIHQAAALVESLCRSWADGDSAKSQAGIIVRELCRAGMLVDAELKGLHVLDITNQAHHWWRADAGPHLTAAHDAPD